MTLKQTIKDILLTVNTQMSDEKANMWTNIILLAIQQDKPAWKGEFAPNLGHDPKNPFPLKIDKGFDYTSKKPEEYKFGSTEKWDVSI